MLAGGCRPSADPGAAALEFREIANAASAGAALPHLATHGRLALLSWVEPAGNGHRLQFARYSDDGWSGGETVATGTGWFVNWADFPAVVPIDTQQFIAHWLVRSGESTYAYDVAVASSVDAGATWLEHGRPHRDGTNTEHGFLTAVPVSDGAVLVWLDGRHMDTSSHDHDSGTPAASGTMSLATATFDPQRGVTQDRIVDGAVCDCCQTDAVTTPDATLVVYRDRDPVTERRDIALLRYADGAWSEPVQIHEDGWILRGCPVNGPAIAALDGHVAVAWFTGAGGVPRVRLALSNDGGRGFTAPVDVDAEAPAGRVDLVLLPDGTALVSWLAGGTDGAALTIARVRPDGTVAGRWPIAASSGARSAGFPQMSRIDDTLLLAWTDDGNPSRIRTFGARLDPAWLAGTASR